MDSLYQIVNGLFGNVDWGESFTVAACKFPGLNKLILSNWVSFNSDIRLPTAFQFVDIFFKLKRLIKNWVMEKRRRDDNELRQIEKDIVFIMDTEGGGMLNQESKDTLVGLQGRRNTLLLEKEETW